jgi:excinuclease ABC subunit B
MSDFKFTSSFKPRGDQPKAIAQLSKGLKENKKIQTLLGVTGSGKGFTIANVVTNYNKPTLILAHNKTLAAQLYNEFKEYFPNNKVEYFVSYYDYYQPESYIAQRDLYIEKNTKINEKIEQLRLSTLASLSSRSDVIVIASVSCIYGTGNPETFKKMGFEISVNQEIKRDVFLKKLIKIQFQRNDYNLDTGNFRVKGNTVDLIPGYYKNFIRVEFFGNTIDKISEIDKDSGKVISNTNSFYVFPAKQFVVDSNEILEVTKNIKKELEERLLELEPLEAQRLKQRTLYDIEMMKETGYCTGIENYSRHFDKRKPGKRPFCLLDFFPKDFLLVIDESHQTIPQLHGMYAGDYSRKKALVDYGFRLPCAFDNRPLKYKEFEKFMNNVIFVSATPGDYERKISSAIVEQLIRPTGLVDPMVYLKPTKDQISDLIKNIKESTNKKYRSLVTTLTKKQAEELSEYLSNQNIKTRYLHSEINTIERTEIIRELRLGKFDCLIGINLLREGIDIPEVGFIGILDADKEGFLRDRKSLIQIIGRAARNADSYVILYADKKTDSIKSAVDETNRRRSVQLEYNKKNNITPRTIIKPIKEKEADITDTKHIPTKEIPNLIIELEALMNKYADSLDFENAIKIRDRINELKKRV